MKTAKELINVFHQPLGKLGCNVHSDILWEHARQRVLEVCEIMLDEHSHYTQNDERWAYWHQIKTDVKGL